jgi:hypothetical protein
MGGFATSWPEDVPGRDYYRPVGSHEIQHLVNEYGCLLVFAAMGSQAFGLPGPRTTALIAAALTWALVNALQYYWFGHALLGASTWVQVVMVGAGIASLVLSLNLLRRRTLRQLRRASSITDLS